MSIILDALRKSEAERLRDAEARQAGLPQARARARMPWWVWGVGLLLLANLLLLGWLLKGTGSTAPVAALPGTTPRAAVRDLDAVAAAGQESLGELAARGAPRRQPELPPAQYPVRANELAAVDTAGTDAALAASAAAAIEAEGTDAGTSPAPAPASPRPTVAAGGLDTAVPAGLPSLEISLHYFDGAGGRSFVNINGRTARAGTLLPEGPVVEQITAEGAILNHRGQRFLLPRN
jgi:general secretion pathway protein B